MADNNADDFADVVRAGSPDLLTIRSDDGTILFVSDAIQRILGFESSEYVGTNCFDHVHPDDQARVREEEGHIDVESAALEHRVRHADGSWIWVESRTRRQDGAHSDMLVSVLRDISTRVALEKQLNRKKVLREAAAAVSPIAIVALDQEGEVLSCMGSLFGMEGAAAFTRLRASSSKVARASALALTGTNSNLDIEWEEQPLESRFISLVTHTVGAIQAICLFLPQFDRATVNPEITRH